MAIDKNNKVWCNNFAFKTSSKAIPLINEFLGILLTRPDIFEEFIILCQSRKKYI